MLLFLLLLYRAGHPFVLGLFCDMEQSMVWSCSVWHFWLNRAASRVLSLAYATRRVVVANLTFSFVHIPPLYILYIFDVFL